MPGVICLPSSTLVWGGGMSPSRVLANSHLSPVVRMCPFPGAVQTTAKSSPAAVCCHPPSTGHHPPPKSCHQLPKAVTHLVQVNAGAQEQLGCAVGEGQVPRQEALQLSPVLGRPRQREAGSWQEQGRGSEQPTRIRHMAWPHTGMYHSDVGQQQGTATCHHITGCLVGGQPQPCLHRQQGSRQGTAYLLGC